MWKLRLLPEYQITNQTLKSDTVLDVRKKSRPLYSAQYGKKFISL